MYNIIPLDEFKNWYDKTTVLAADVFEAIPYYRKKRRNKNDYCYKLLDALFDNLFCALITDLEVGKLKKNIGKEKVYNFFSSLRQNEKAKCFQIRTAHLLSQYKESEAFGQLYRLAEDKNLHWVNLSSIVAAIELDIPLVSNDPHFWIYNNNRIKDACKVKGSKNMVLYTPQDFCKLVLYI